MLGMSSELKNKILKHVTGVESYKPSIDIAVALYVGGNELTSDTGYKRQLVMFKNAIDGEVVNKGEIIFPIASKMWGVIDEVAIVDSDNKILFMAKTSQNKTIERGDQLRFEDGALSIKIDG